MCWELREIKKFIVAFDKPTIIQTDNGGEFNNNISDIYYENNNIKHINSGARYPESNGQIESAHKTIQKAIKIVLVNDFINFGIYDVLTECLNKYNNEMEHSSTGYKPAFLKDIQDEDIIKKSYF